MAPVYGKARKAGLLALIVSSLGWLIYLIFFCLTLSDKTYRDRINPAFFPHWLFLVLGPPLYIIIIIHLVFNERFHLQSIINAFLALYLLCGGGIIYTDWILYYLEYRYSTRYMFEFASCTLAVVGVVFYTLFIPCFKKPRTVDQMTHLQASNTESKDKETMETITVTLPMDEMTTVNRSNSNPVKEDSSTFIAHSYVDSPINKTIPRVNNSTSPVNKSIPVPIPSVVNQPNRNNEAAETATGDGYTSLIAQCREELPLYEKTRSPSRDEDEDIYVNDDDQDIYMNDDENEPTDHNMYEDVSDLKRNQDEYAEVSNMEDPQEEYAEVVDRPEEQYEELNQ